MALGGAGLFIDGAATLWGSSSLSLELLKLGRSCSCDEGPGIGMEGAGGAENTKGAKWGLKTFFFFSMFCG